MEKITFILAFFSLLSYGSPCFSQSKPDKRAIIVTEIATPEMNVVNNKLYVKNAPLGKRVEVFTVIGNKVRQIEMKSVVGEYELNLPKAIYIFKLDGVVKKFVIK
jgi:hypothetical protein